MRSRYDTIAAQSRAVVDSSATATSVCWWYRALTSLPNARPPIYADWADIWGLPTAEHEAEQYDNDRNMVKLVTMKAFRTSDQQPRLSEGWQLFDPKAQRYWQVTGIESQGPGTLRWQLQRIVGILGTPDRKTGV